MPVKFFILFTAFLLVTGFCKAKLVITGEPSTLTLVQKLVGDSVAISNVSFTGNSLMAGKFKNTGNLTNIGLDSGIVLTNGKAKTVGVNIGMDGDGVTPANSTDFPASIGLELSGDASFHQRYCFKS